LLIAQDGMLITTHFGDRLDLTDYVDQMIRLGDTDFRSPENERFLMKLGQCIALSAGPNAPHAVLVHLRDRMHPDLWAFVDDQWATAAELRYIGEDGKPASRPPQASAS
jgi:hypothetical protein